MSESPGFPEAAQRPEPRVASGLRSPAPDGLRILPIAGLPDFRPGDNLAAAIADAAPWIADGDVLVVTSKIVSKAEGRLVAAPSDPEERDAFRRKLIDAETVRLVAQVGRTKIVENSLGIIAAAAGIDASNVRNDEIALLPTDPDASAAAMVQAFAGRGLRVGVVITDTQGRAWRSGVTDVAIGAAGVPVLDDHRGGVDEFGNELVVTQVAVGDEMAAAADLVKGKLSGVPVAVLRGVDAPGLGPAVEARPQDPALLGGGRSLIRPHQEDLFRLGTDLALAQGRREAVLLIGERGRYSHDPVDVAVLEHCLAKALAGAAGERVAGTPGIDWILVRDQREALWSGTSGEAASFADQPAELMVPVLTTGSTSTPAVVWAGSVIARFLVALAAEGLQADWISAIEPAAIREALTLAPADEPLGVIVIGHPAAPLRPAQPAAAATLVQR